MTRFETTDPASIIALLEWMTVFRECRTSTDGHWFNTKYSNRVKSVSLTVTAQRADGTLTPETQEQLQRGLLGLGGSIAGLTPNVVQAAVSELSHGNHDKVVITDGVAITTTAKLITVTLSNEAYKAFLRYRQLNYEAYKAASHREALLHLLDIIAEGTTTTIVGKIMTKEAQEALAYLETHVVYLLPLPAHLAELVEQDED